MRLESLPPFFSGGVSRGAETPGSDMPFGDMFQQASKEDAGVRMIVQEDGSFLMASAEDDIEGRLASESGMSDLQLETQLLQGMVAGPAFGLDQLPDLSVSVLQEVRSILGMPVVMPKEAPLMIRVRFEKNAQGLVIVVQLVGDDLFAKAQDQKSVLQTRLSDILDRSVLVRFVQLGDVDLAFEESPSQSGFQQGRQQQDNPHQSQASLDALSEGDEAFSYV